MYLNRRNQIKIKKKMIIGLAAAVIFGLLFFGGVFSNMFWRTMIALSILKTGNENSASTFLGIFYSKDALQKENQSLKAQLEQAKLDREAAAAQATSTFSSQIVVSTSSRLISPSISSSSLFSSTTASSAVTSIKTTETSEKRLTAQLLSKPPFTPFDILTISGGEDKGFKVGQRVMLGDVILGRLTTVAKDSSRITLISSPGTRTNVLIGAKLQPGVLMGKGGGNFEILLPQGTKVAKGDEVITNDGSKLLTVGTVSAIVQNKNSTFLTLLLAFPINLYELSHVEIVLN
jgi:cell shape-determining protein MreC